MIDKLCVEKNLEGSGRGLVLFRHLSGGTETDNEKPESGQPVPTPRYEPQTSRIRSRSVNHSTKTFDIKRLKEYGLILAVSWQLTHSTTSDSFECKFGSLCNIYAANCRRWA
jgi:hypothetical protein